MRLLAVAQRIDVRVASGEQDAIEVRDHGIDVICIGNQADVQRSTAGGLDGLAVVAPKIETIGCLFNAHRDADAWSCLHHPSGAIPSAAIITYVRKTHHYIDGRRP